MIFLYFIFLLVSFFLCRDTPQWATGPLHYQGFTITLPLHSVGLLWTGDQPVAETTHNTHWRKISKPLAEFESAIQARDRPQSHTLDGEAAVIGFISKVYNFYLTNVSIVSNPRAGLPWMQGLTSSRGQTSLVHCVRTGFAALAACIQTVFRAVSADVRRQVRVSAQSLPSTARVNPFVTSGTYMSHLQRVFSSPLR